MKQHPVETRQKARRLREQGLGYKLIAREIGVSHSSVQRWLKPDYAERQRQRQFSRRERYRKPCP